MVWCYRECATSRVAKQKMDKVKNYSHNHHNPEQFCYQGVHGELRYRPKNQASDRESGYHVKELVHADTAARRGPNDNEVPI